jgi:hypothetical protein
MLNTVYCKHVVIFKAWYTSQYLPSILEMFELCMSGQAFRIFRLSSFAHTMKAFIGRFIWGLFSPSLFCCLTILAEIEARNKWLGSYNPIIKMFKFFHTNNRIMQQRYCLHLQQYNCRDIISSWRAKGYFKFKSYFYYQALTLKAYIKTVKWAYLNRQYLFMSAIPNSHLILIWFFSYF